MPLLTHQVQRPRSRAGKKRFLSQSQRRRRLSFPTERFSIRFVTRCPRFGADCLFRSAVFATSVYTCRFTHTFIDKRSRLVDASRCSCQPRRGIQVNLPDREGTRRAGCLFAGDKSQISRRFRLHRGRIIESERYTGNRIETLPGCARPRWNATRTCVCVCCTRCEATFTCRCNVAHVPARNGKRFFRPSR